VSGGYSNTAGGYCSTVSGGAGNTASSRWSLAAGRRAKATHDGTFVWADSQNADVSSTANNQVTFRCSGGVRFLSGSGGANQQVEWAPGGSSWSFSSDRNLKEEFTSVDSEEILEKVTQLPLTEWNFKGYGLRHIGPMAQDFHAAFRLGGSETTIDGGDLDGVALAAIQGLHQIVREKDAQLASQQREISSLEARVSALEQDLRALAEKAH